MGLIRSPLGADDVHRLELHTDREGHILQEGYDR